MNFVPRLCRNVRSTLSGPTKKYTSSAPSNPTPPPPPTNPTPPSPTNPTPPSPTNPSVNSSFNSNVKYPLTKTRKILCVWAKRYPSLKDVPDHVSPEVWSKVRSVIRIKVANYTMLLMLIGCAGMVISGKRARDRGESLVQRNLDWHKKYAEGKEEDVKNIGVFGK